MIQIFATLILLTLILQNYFIFLNKRGFLFSVYP